MEPQEKAGRSRPAINIGCDGNGAAPDK